MAEKNNIDKLFADKLGAGEVGGYSEAAWSGASAMLDRHYRLLFWKRAAMITVPLLMVAGLTWWAWPKQDVTEIAAPETSSTTVIEQNAPQPQETTGYSAHEVSSNESASKEAVGSKSIKSESTQGNSAPEKAGTEEVASTEESPRKSISEASNSSLRTRESQEIVSDQMLAKDLGRASVAAYDNSGSSVGALENTNEIELSLGLMPTFNVNGVGAGNAQGILGRDKLKKEKPSLPASRIELKLGAGLIGASSVETVQGHWSNGYYISAEGAYRLKERLFASVGIVYNERSSVIRDFSVVANDQKLQVRSIGYLDIPLQIGYRLGARHSISFGMIFSPLARVNQEDVGFGIPWNIETVIENDQGHRPGFASFDAAGTLGYQFQLSERFFANAQLRYGLFDVTDDEFYMTGDQDDRNHQIRIGLSYRILNR